MLRVKKFCAEVNPAATGETAEELFSGEGKFRAEKIVSRGAASPKGFWYDQSEDEFAMLVSGASVILFADGKREEFAAGDAAIIYAGERHRVEKVSADAVWLTFFGCFKTRDKPVKKAPRYP